jgi:hypothetical protein
MKKFLKNLFYLLGIMIIAISSSAVINFETSSIADIDVSFRSQTDHNSSPYKTTSHDSDSRSSNKGNKKSEKSEKSEKEVQKEKSKAKLLFSTFDHNHFTNIFYLLKDSHSNLDQFIRDGFLTKLFKPPSVS